MSSFGILSDSSFQLEDLNNDTGGEITLDESSKDDTDFHNIEHSTSSTNMIDKLTDPIKIPTNSRPLTKVIDVNLKNKSNQEPLLQYSMKLTDDNSNIDIRDAFLLNNLDQNNNNSLFMQKNLNQLNEIWDYCLKINEPIIFLQYLIQMSANSETLISIEIFQRLIDCFHPFISQAKIQGIQTFSQIRMLVFELITNLISNYPPEDNRFNYFVSRTIHDYIQICKVSKPEFQIYLLRLLNQIFRKVNAYYPQSDFKKFLVEFLSTFNPSHFLFKASFHVLRNSYPEFDEICYLKILIHSKFQYTIEMFDIIDEILSRHRDLQKSSSIVQFFLNIALSEPIWCFTVIRFIQKYSIFIQQEMNWVKLFVRRTLQWARIASKSGIAEQYISMIAQLMKALYDISTEDIQREISIDISTLKIITNIIKI